MELMIRSPAAFQQAWQGCVVHPNGAQHIDVERGPDRGLGSSPEWRKHHDASIFDDPPETASLAPDDVNRGVDVFLHRYVELCRTDIAHRIEPLEIGSLPCARQAQYAVTLPHRLPVFLHRDALIDSEFLRLASEVRTKRRLFSDHSPVGRC